MTKTKYAVILGNQGNTRDRFCDGYKDNQATYEMVKRAAQIPHVGGIELVVTWDIEPHNVREINAALGDYGLKCVSIIPDLFGNELYWKRSYSCSNPKIRRKAIENTTRMCDIARELDCPMLNLWPGLDGCDHLLCADYESEIAWLSQSIAELASPHPDLRFALDNKPREPDTHSHMARIADTLLLAIQTGCDNVGITIDTGHAFAGGKAVAETIVLAKRSGNRLLHTRFDDDHTTTDGDMIVDTFHSVCYIEMLYWLRRCGYKGWLSMGQYPYREDPASAIGESISWLEQFAGIVDRDAAKIGKLLLKQDAIATSRYLRSILAPAAATEKANIAAAEHS